MATTSVSGSVSVKLHPLVIMNISDHWTRVRAQGQPQQVYGALIGKQNGRSLEVLNSFGLKCMEIDGDVIVNQNYYIAKEEQFKQVFKDLDLLGWYTTGDSPTDQDVKVHKQISGIIESPIFLKLNPSRVSTDLPMSVYESVIDIADGNAVTRLVNLNYTLATEEAERIGVDHIVKVSSTETGAESLASEHLHGQHNAISMLYARIQLILAYVRAVKNGELPRNHEIMRSAHALCRRLPVLGSEYLTQDLQNQYSDVTLMTYLGVMSKGSQTMNQFISKFSVLYDRQGAGRRVRGLFL